MGKSSTSKILGMLIRHKSIRAALQIDGNGKIQAREGQALSLQASGAEDTTMLMPIDTSKEGPQEAIYICDFDEDFLVVIFDEDAEFDPIKRDVDELLEQFG